MITRARLPLRFVSLLVTAVFVLPLAAIETQASGLREPVWSGRWRTIRRGATS